jgi:hypothetical protein
MVKQSGYRQPPGMLMRYTVTAPAHFYGFVSKSFTLALLAGYAINQKER